MKTIWKYKLKQGENRIELPLHYIPLDVQMQGNVPVLWILVETENDTIMPTFYIYGTGDEIDSELNLRYIGTFQDIPFAYHLFEEIICLK